MRALSVLVVLVVCVGCATPAPPEPGGGAVARLSPMSWVKAGMSADEVRGVLGEPALIEKQAEDELTEHWYYGSGGVVVLHDGEVQFKGQAAGRTN